MRLRSLGFCILAKCKVKPYQLRKLLMQRRCSNCIHSQFEGYCGQMAVCDDWKERKTYAELLPSKRQIKDELKLNHLIESAKTNKSSKRKSRRKHKVKKKKPTDQQFMSEAVRKRNEANAMEYKRIWTTYENLEPIHAFPRKECTKAIVIKKVRGW